ncbi:MAG: phosphoribosylglycinamide formyltransferase [Candidatus Promineifilaceae bacterium]
MSEGRRKARLVVLISGSGSNLQVLIDAVSAETLHATIELVISNRRDAYGLTRAKQANIPTCYFPFGPYRKTGQTRNQYDADLAQKIATVQPDLIVLAGWMRILTSDFLNVFPKRVINLHPALPGQFDGTHAIERAYAAYQAGEISHSGCMVHLAIPAVDAGPVIKQAIVPIFPNDSLATFAERIHSAEHKLILAATQTMLSETW